jgi:hypothetical protein
MPPSEAGMSAEGAANLVGCYNPPANQFAGSYLRTGCCGATNREFPG